jgi:hypothetical protein
MLEYRYTRFGNPEVIYNENLDYLKEIMISAFYSGSCCCQRIIDNDNKIVYVIIEGSKDEYDADLSDYKEIVI